VGKYESKKSKPSDTGFIFNPKNPSLPILISNKSSLLMLKREKKKGC